MPTIHSLMLYLEVPGSPFFIASKMGEILTQKKKNSKGPEFINRVAQTSQNFFVKWQVVSLAAYVTHNVTTHDLQAGGTVGQIGQ